MYYDSENHARMKACTGSIPVSGVDSCSERSEKLCGIAASLLRARHKTAADNSPRLFCLTRRQGAQIGRRASGGLFVHTVLCSRREQASLGRTISELFLLCAHSGTNRSRRRRGLFVHAVLCSRREQASLGHMPLRGLSAALLLQRFFALPLLRRQTVTSRRVPFSSA